MWLTLAELPPSMRRNLYLELAYGATAGVVSALSMLAPVTVLTSLDGGKIDVTILGAVMPGASLLQPLWAHVARRYRLQDMALASGALRCLPLLAVSLVTVHWLFTAMFVAYHLLNGPLSLAVPSLYKYTYVDSHRGRIIGVLRMVQQSVAVAVLLGNAWILDGHPDLYRLTYPIGGLIGLAGLLFYRSLRIPGDRPEDRLTKSEPPTLSNIRTVLRQDVNFRLFQSSIFLTGAGFLMSRPIWIYLLRDQFQLNQVELSFLVMIMPIILGAITSPVWGAIIDWTSPVAGRAAFALLGIFAYAALFGSFQWDWLVLAYVGAFLRGTVLGAAEVSLTTGNLYFSIHPERAALYESISATFQGIRGLVMPLLGYVLFLQIGTYLFLFPTVLNAWSLVVAMRLLRHKKDARIAAALVDEAEV